MSSFILKEFLGFKDYIKDKKLGEIRHIYKILNLFPQHISSSQSSMSLSSKQTLAFIIVFNFSKNFTVRKEKHI